MFCARLSSTGAKCFYILVVFKSSLQTNSLDLWQNVLYAKVFSTAASLMPMAQCSQDVQAL